MTFESSFSVPGVSLRLAFKDVAENFYLFSKRHRDLVTLFLSQNVGGPALIFDRYQEAGLTTIGHEVNAPITKKILGLGKTWTFIEYFKTMPFSFPSSLEYLDFEYL